MSQPSISVVVIGRNEGPRLVECLKSVRAGIAPEIPAEVIYVDSDSTDGSAGKAAECGAKVIAIRGGKLSAARARNAGWRAAGAPLVLFLDGDSRLDPEFVARAIPEFDNPNIAVVSGRLRETRPEFSIYNRLLGQEWIDQPGFVEFCGGNAMMRRSSLEEVNGFHADLIAGEEPELCCRLRARGGLILQIDAPMADHDLAMESWRQYWRRAVRTGHAYAQISELSSRTSAPVWAAESRRNLVQGAVYSIAPAALAIAFAVTHSLIPMAAGLGAAAALILRTALRSRRRGMASGLLLLYAIHSHLQQIPIFCGQLIYLVNQRRSRVQELIEYKGGA
ncbi:MAG: glycosyltransferase [Acidobacteriia bacterium]|nr:glycosyltransferase [Terriglobia bacterium]